MSQLASFFKGSDTRLGVFYPANYITATFSSLERAKQAERRLRRAGFSSEEVLAVAGDDLVTLMKEHTTPVSVLMTEISRFLDTEANYSDRDVRDARFGAAILAVYCADEAAKKSAWNLIAPELPIRARYYALSSVEHLVGES